ncbi:MAG TPA: hypothetical protein VJ948_10140 [Acidimicrobiia bacterium]|nr:hypothetical protein [Acidimicrobiia bacterium]
MGEEPKPDPTLTTEALAVSESLDEIASVFDDAESEDLTMAWSDLDADLRSVVADLVRDPDSVDVDGMQARVEGFITRFQSETMMSKINGEWDDLLTRLEKLAGRPRLMGSP